MRVRDAPSHLPEGDGLGDSLLESIIVGRIGPIPSTLLPRELDGRRGFLCSAGVSFLTGLGVSATIALDLGALAVSVSRALVDCGTDLSFKPSAARSPAARISSSVSLAGTDFFPLDFDLRGVGVGVSEEICSDGWTGGDGTACFFSRATITSCACNLPTQMMMQNSGPDIRFSMTPPNKPMNPFTSRRSRDVPNSIRRASNLNYG
jgi:hypothetical protein